MNIQMEKQAERHINRQMDKWWIDIWKINYEQQIQKHIDEQIDGGHIIYGYQKIYEQMGGLDSQMNRSKVIQ